MKAVEPASCTEAMRSNKEASPGSYGRVELINLKGSTVFISPSGQLVSTLRRDAALLQGVPLAALRLKSGGKELCDDDLIADVIAKGVPVRTALRLLGGKGGFGAMLRSAGKNGVKTTNFDACRDLNGRRLRHVNTEAKLREWEALAEERKRAKYEKKLQKKQAQATAAEPARFDDDEYEEMLETTRQAVSASVASTIAAARGAASSNSDGDSDKDKATSGEKRAAEAPAEEAPKPKAAKLFADPLAMLEAEGSDSDESTSEEKTGEKSA